MGADCEPLTGSLHSAEKFADTLEITPVKITGMDTYYLYCVRRDRCSR
jgi:hypothetical protein